MYHHYRKDSSYLRSAIWDEYKHKCFYCTHIVALRDMHVDHIFPTNAETVYDAEILEYLSELQKNGFDFDSIENYAPTCPSCNRDKSNKVYNASSLRFYHDKANRKVDAVLKRIDQLKQSTEEYFYSPVDSSIWEPIDFSEQHDISYAVLGYRLSPKDVEACPRFPQVERIKKRLNMVHHAYLQGETGCGKSISAYQAAYDFSKAGWQVFRYNNQELESEIVIPSNTENSLYIIDDAQILSNAQKRTLEEKAKQNCKILFTETITTRNVKQDTILLTNIEAVEIMFNSFMKRKEELLPIIHQQDPDVGEGRLDTPLERRLYIAKEELTPWMFTYVLRGGWQTIRGNYQAVISHNNCDLLSAAIAAFQIMQRDNCVPFDWLCSKLHSIDSTYSWNESDLEYLVDKKVVYSIEDVRIVHLQSANALFAYFYIHSDKKKRKVILDLIESSVLEDRISPLGIVWLCNGPFRYLPDIAEYEKSIITANTIAHVFEHLQCAESDEERTGIAYFWEKLFRIHFDGIGREYFVKYMDLLHNWINNPSGNVAYAYSELVNELINYDKDLHKQFTKEVEWEKVIYSMRMDNTANLYSWGRLLNRLTYSYSEAQNNTVGLLLNSAISVIQERITVESIYSFSSFLCEVYHIMPDKVHCIVRGLSSKYRQAFAKSPERILELFNFEFLTYICGIDFFGNRRPINSQKETSVSMVDAIPEKEFARLISNSKLRDWDAIYDIMYLIKKYNASKAKRIIGSVNIHQLSNAAKKHWDQSRDICLLCEALQYGVPSIARRFIEICNDAISIVYSTIVIIHPLFAISQFAAGKEVELLHDHNWGISHAALKMLIQTNEPIAKEIIASNHAKICKSMSKISSIDLDDNSLYHFLYSLKQFSPQDFSEIASHIDEEKIRKSLQLSSFSKKVISKRETRLDRILRILAE